MAEKIERLVYEKTWMSADDFPTVETDEAQVRADLQFFPDAIRNYINDNVVGVCNAMIEVIESLPEMGAGDMVRRVYDPDRISRDIYAYAREKSEEAKAQAISSMTSKTNGLVVTSGDKVLINTNPDEEITNGDVVTSIVVANTLHKIKDPRFIVSNVDLVPGVSPLETGMIYLFYE